MATNRALGKCCENKGPSDRPGPSCRSVSNRTQTCRPPTKTARRPKKHMPSAAMVKPPYMLRGMCGRSTYKLTWEGIARLCRLMLDQSAVDTR
jgi:hypothetical protein